MEDFGLPTWGSYLIIAIATIVSGAILGLVSLNNKIESFKLKLMKLTVTYIL